MMSFASLAILLICSVSYVLSFNMPPLDYGLKFNQALLFSNMPPVFGPSLQRPVMPIQNQMKNLKGNLVMIKKINPETGVWVQSVLQNSNPTAAIQHVANKLKKIIDMKRHNVMIQNRLASGHTNVNFDSRLSMSNVFRRLLKQNKFGGSIYENIRKGIPLSNLNLFPRNFDRPIKMRTFQKFGMDVNPVDDNVAGLGLINKYQKYNSLRGNNLVSNSIPKRWKSSPLRQQRIKDFSSDAYDTTINDFEGVFDDREFDIDFAANLITDDDEPKNRYTNRMAYGPDASEEDRSLENDEDGRFHYNQQNIGQIRGALHTRNPSVRINVNGFAPTGIYRNEAVFGKQNNANVNTKKQWINKGTVTNVSSKLNTLHRDTINNRQQDTFIDSRDYPDSNSAWTAKSGDQNAGLPTNNVLNTGVFHGSGNGDKMAKQFSELPLHRENKHFGSNVGIMLNTQDDTPADEIKKSLDLEISPAFKEDTINAGPFVTDIQKMEIFKTKSILDNQSQTPVGNNLMPLLNVNNSLQEKSNIKVLPFNPHQGENFADGINHEDIIDLDQATFALLGIGPTTVGLESEIEERDDGIMDDPSRKHIPISQNTWINQKTLTNMVDMYPADKISTQSTGKDLQMANIPNGQSLTNSEMIGNTFKDSFDRLDNMEFGFDSFDKDLTNFDVFASR